MSTIEVKVPDIGDFKDVPVIEILVKPGDVVAKDSPLVTLESDKATVEVPSPFPGTVKEVKVKLGDRLSKGSIIVTLDAAEGSTAAAPAQKPPAAVAPSPACRRGRRSTSRSSGRSRRRISRASSASAARRCIATG